MPGVGALPKESFVSEFAARSFTVKVMDYNGFNHRLQVSPVLSGRASSLLPY